MCRIKVFIQAEAGSPDRDLYNEKTLEFKERRRLPRSFPYAYGFIVGTSAADGDCVDCYIITADRLKAGSIVECEPFGLLEQDEDGEIDHKVLAALPGQEVEPGQELVDEIREFVCGVTAHLPDVHMRIGRLLPREAALRHIEQSRNGQS